jgi:hypothetical protein
MNRHSLLSLALTALCPVSSLAYATPQSHPALPDGIRPNDWGQIRSAIAAQRHHFQSTEDGYEAVNPGLQMTARFDGSSTMIEPLVGGWQFGLALRSFGFKGRTTPAATPEFGTCTTGQELTYDWSEGLSEWWINDPRGFEHGFNVWERPAYSDETDSRGPLAFSFDVLGTLAPQVNDMRTGLVLRDERGEVALRYEGLFAVDANGVMLEAWLEVAGPTLKIYVDESNAQYPIVVDPLIQQAYLKASNTGPDDIFGFSVAASGDTVVVGAEFEDSAATGVNGDEGSNSAFESGAAYVFVRSGSTWTQEAYLKASNAEAFEFFGFALAASGDTVVVSAPSEDSAATGVNGNEADNSASLSGAAYVFVRSSGTWRQAAYLKASNTDREDLFGRGVAVSGDTVIVTAQGEASGATGVNGDGSDNAVDGSGAAYVFSTGLVDPGVGENVCFGTVNSTGFAGTLTALGSPIVADNSLALEAACCPPESFGLVITSSSNGGPIQSIPAGEGVLCIDNSQVGRFSPMMTNATGNRVQSVDLGAIPTHVGTAAALPGDTYYFQFWHRDSLGGVATSNLTSAISVLFE